MATNFFRKNFLFFTLCAIGSLMGCEEEKNPMTIDHLALPSMSMEAAENLADLAINCIQTAYPNKLSHIMQNETEVQSPKVLHPAFYGCFDWHSSVHGHWMLVKLLKKFPSLPQGETIRQMISANLTAENIAQEVSYINLPHQKSFERMYGWAWLLKLAQELGTWEDVQARVWYKTLSPLTQAIVNRYKEFLPRQTYPVRTGLHSNTAFGLSYAWDYALEIKDDSLANLISSVGKLYYFKDKDCPADWEPSGSDFLSPCLEEANLMRRILEPDTFRVWLQDFLPGLKSGKPHQLLNPAEVADRNDPQIVHLDGLNLSRAWCMMGIASVLHPQSQEYNLLLHAAEKHIKATMPHVASGNYEGEHWLGSFAVYALSVGEDLAH